MQVKSCWLIEGGMIYRPHWIGPCCTSTVIAPWFYGGDDMERIRNGYVPTLEEIMEKRRKLFEQVNDPNSQIVCQKCAYLLREEYGRC